MKALVLKFSNGNIAEVLRVYEREDRAAQDLILINGQARNILTPVIIDIPVVRLDGTIDESMNINLAEDPRGPKEKRLP